MNAQLTSMNAAATTNRGSGRAAAAVATATVRTKPKLLIHAR